MTDDDADSDAGRAAIGPQDVPRDDRRTDDRRVRDRRADDRRGDERSFGSQWAPAIVTGLAVFALVFGFVLLRRGTTPAPVHGYDDATRSLFVGSCASGGETSTRDICTCTYDRIVASIPYDRFRDATVAGATAPSNPSPSGSSGSSGSSRSSGVPGSPPAGSSAFTQPPPAAGAAIPADFDSLLRSCVDEQRRKGTVPGTAPAGLTVGPPATAAPPTTSRGTVVRAQPAG